MRKAVLEWRRTADMDGRFTSYAGVGGIETDHGGFLRSTPVWIRENVQLEMPNRTARAMGVVPTRMRQTLRWMRSQMQSSH